MYNFFNFSARLKNFLNEMFGGKKSSSQHFSVFGSFSSLSSCPAPGGKEGRPRRKVTSAVAPNPPADPTRQHQTVTSPLLPTVTTWRAASQGGKSGCPLSVPPPGAPHLVLGCGIEAKGKTWPPTPARPTHSGQRRACPTLGVASMLGEQKQGFEFYKWNK